MRFQSQTLELLKKKGSNMEEEHEVPEKRMDIKEFRELGYLQELNRNFLHPLGLSLEVIIDEETGGERFGGIWDYRDDPEGLLFAENTITMEKAAYVARCKMLKVQIRDEKHNCVDGVQLPYRNEKEYRKWESMVACLDEEMNKLGGGG